MKRRTWVMAAVLVAAFGVVALSKAWPAGGTARGSKARASAVDWRTEECRTDIPLEGVADPARIVHLPPDPSSVLACVYVPIGYGADRQVRLKREVTLHGRDARKLVARLDGSPLTRPEESATSCPLDNGSRVFIYVRSRRGRFAIEVKASGCWSIKPINPEGRSRVLSPGLRRYLLALRARS